MEIKNCNAYELIEKQELKDLNSTGYLLRHKKTKARIALIENDDENKVFTIGFRTPPKDSTGVAHIVEHTVLCGSKDFPVKDPFIELAKGSLNTFLNAMTYPDKTVYPVASCNAKDFQNLMHVYMDAVFYPNIYKEEKIFRQEGWHYELDSVDEPLRYNGVVFNEMKGVFSSPDQLLARNIQQSLFPDTAYGVESGGDPVDIPNLTYEDYLDFHRTYYHPSNSYIYLYGDMDMEEKLNWIDENYLSDFDYLEVDSELATQEAFKEMDVKYGFYSAAEDEDTEGKAYFSYNVVLEDSLDPKLYRSFRILDHVLIDTIGAPLKQALMDAGIGSEIDSMYESSIKQPFFSIMAKNVRMEQKDEFLAIIRETLEKIVKEGLNKKSVLAAINSMEFQTREADYGSYPKGLMYGLQMFDSWLYDDTKPFVHICPNATFSWLREQIGTGYFESLIQKYFLDNTHASFVSVEPKVGLTGLMEKEESERLASYKSSLNREEQENLVKATRELKEYQEEPDAPEALTCIPLLERDDIEKKAKPFCNEETEVDGCKVLRHNVFTNGISYIKLVFEVGDLKEYASYISLLSELIGGMDTDEHDKLELSNEILLHSGGFSMSTDAYRNRQTGREGITIEMNTKVMVGETGYLLNLIREIMLSTRLEDEKRLREVIGEERSARQTGMLASGHNTAVWRGLSYLNEQYYEIEQLRGISYYHFLSDLEEHFDERKEELIAILKGLAETIFTAERMSVSVTSEDEGYEVLKKELTVLLKQMPESLEMKLPTPVWKPEKLQVNEGFKTASKVQYVARVGNFGKKNVEYSGTFKVVKTILGYDYLWNNVRVKGGAYGVMCSFFDTGYGYFVSYRDPNLASTNEVYKGVPEYLKNFSADERDMMKYIIGTISDMDIPLTPRAVGERSYSAYLRGVTFEEKQRERDEVLAADEKKVREAAEMAEALLAEERICVLGGEEKVKEAKELFDTVQTW